MRIAAVFCRTLMARHGSLRSYLGTRAVHSRPANLYQSERGAMMKLTAALLALWCMCGWAVEPDPDNIPVIAKDDIQGPNLEAVLTALPEAARRRLDYRKYRITVCTVGDQLMVLFSDLNKSLARPGSPTMPAFAVKLSADGKTVTGFEWQR